MQRTTAGIWSPNARNSKRSPKAINRTGNDDADAFLDRYLARPEARTPKFSLGLCQRLATHCRKCALCDVKELARGAAGQGLSNAELPAEERGGTIAADDENGRLRIRIAVPAQIQI